MKNTFKIKLLGIFFAALLPLAAAAADSASGKPEGKAPSAEERKARMEQCKSDPAKCRAERETKREQWCKDNPQRCKEIKDRREKRMADCKANPEKCQAEKKARIEQMCKDSPERCKDMKEKMDKRRAEKKAQIEQRFKRADADGNGAINRAEAENAANGLPRLARHFDRFDANKDGQVTIEEIAAARKARFEQRGRRPGRVEPTQI
ncbi:MAG TPA: hypothetical protein VK663_02320 [Burkholderiales bacterium]|nr:hypothetical protein [Burkholderiales bacterium]